MYDIQRFSLRSRKKQYPKQSTVSSLESTHLLGRELGREGEVFCKGSKVAGCVGPAPWHAGWSSHSAETERRKV